MMIDEENKINNNETSTFTEIRDKEKLHDRRTLSKRWVILTLICISSVKKIKIKKSLEVITVLVLYLYYMILLTNGFNF